MSSVSMEVQVCIIQKCGFLVAGGVWLDWISFRIPWKLAIDVPANDNVEVLVLRCLLVRGRNTQLPLISGVWLPK